MSDISTKPYFIRAWHEWCTDSGLTPYLAVAVDERTVVPREFVQNDQITLNVGVMATDKLLLNNDFVSFRARFGGVARDISIPVVRVQAIYAKETGQGMAFEVEEYESDSEDSAPVQKPQPTERASDLTTTASVAQFPSRANAALGSLDKPRAERDVAGVDKDSLNAKVDSSEKSSDGDEPPPSRPRLVRVK